MAFQGMDYEGEEIDNDSVYCDICKIGFTSQQTFENHKKGKVHEMKVAALKVVQEKKQEWDKRASPPGDTQARSDKEVVDGQSEHDDGEIEWQDEWSNERDQQQGTTHARLDHQHSAGGRGYRDEQRHYRVESGEYDPHMDRGYRDYRDIPRRDRSPLNKFDSARDRFDPLRDRFDQTHDRYDYMHTRSDWTRDRYDQPRDRFDQPHGRFDLSRDRFDPPRERFDRSRPSFNDHPAPTNYPRPVDRYSGYQSDHPGISRAPFPGSAVERPNMPDAFPGSQRAPPIGRQFNKVVPSSREHVAAGSGPNTVKRNQPKLSKEFYCSVCECQMTGPVSYNAHMVGARHAKMMKVKVLTHVPPAAQQANDVSGGDDPDIASFELPTEARAQKLVEEHRGEALIGLRYITEFVSGNRPAKYVCNMCECRCDINTLLPHVTGIKHRVNYMRENFMNYYTQLQQNRKSVNTYKDSNANLVEEFAQEIQVQTGREKIKVKVDTTNTSKDDVQKLISLKQQLDLAEELKAKNHPAVVQADATRFTINDALGKHPGEQSAVVEHGLMGKHKVESAREWAEESESGSAGPGPAGGASSLDGFGALGLGLGAAGSAGLAEVVKELSSCLVNNEEEAALALQVSNTLTQALLRYRLGQSHNYT